MAAESGDEGAPLKRIGLETMARVLEAFGEHTLLMADQLGEIVGRGVSRERVGQILRYMGSDRLPSGVRRQEVETAENGGALVELAAARASRDHSLGLLDHRTASKTWRAAKPEVYFLTALGVAYVRALPDFDGWRPSKSGHEEAAAVTAHHLLGTNEVGRVFSAGLRAHAMAALAQTDLSARDRLDFARSTCSTSWQHEVAHRFADGPVVSTANTVRADGLLTAAFQEPPGIGADLRYQFFVEVDRNTGTSPYVLGDKLLAYQRYRHYVGKDASANWPAVYPKNDALAFDGYPVVLFVFAGQHEHLAKTRMGRFIRLVRSRANYPGLEGVEEEVGVLAITMWDLVKHGPFGGEFIEVFGSRKRGAFGPFVHDTRDVRSFRPVAAAV